MLAQEARHYDAVFVFPGYTVPQREVPKGNKEGRAERFFLKPKTTDKTGLLFDSRLKDISAALIGRQGEADTIVTMSRKTRGWMDHSNAQLGHDHIQSILNIKRRNIRLLREEVSFDTGSEVEAVRRMSQEQGFGNVAIIVTDEKTKERVRNLIKDQPNFPKYELRDIDDVLHDPSYHKPAGLTDVVERYDKSKFAKYFWPLRETIIGAIERNPIGKKLINRTADKSRH